MRHPPLYNLLACTSLLLLPLRIFAAADATIAEPPTLTTKAPDQGWSNAGRIGFFFSNVATSDNSASSSLDPSINGAHGSEAIWPHGTTPCSGAATRRASTRTCACAMGASTSRAAPGRTTATRSIMTGSSVATSRSIPSSMARMGWTRSSATASTTIPWIRSPPRSAPASASTTMPCCWMGTLPRRTPARTVWRPASGCARRSAGAASTSPSRTASRPPPPPPPALRPAGRQAAALVSPV